MKPGDRVRFAEAWVEQYPDAYQAEQRALVGTITAVAPGGTKVHVLWDGGVECAIDPRRLALATTNDRNGFDEEMPMTDAATAETPALPVLHRTTRLLPVVLTDAEMRGRAQEQASVYRELGRHHDHADSVKAQLKATERRLEARLSELAEMINRGTEERDIPIEIVADYPAGLAREIRTDTGEILLERKLEAKERQQSMFPGDGAAVPGVPAGDEVVGDVIQGRRINEIVDDALAAGRAERAEPVDPPVSAAEATTRARRKKK